MASTIQHADNGEAYLPIAHLGLRLTPYRHDEVDVTAMMDISNAPEVAKWSYKRPYPYTAEHANSWLDTMVPAQQSTLSILADPPTEPSRLMAGTTPTVTASPFVVIRQGDIYVGDVSLMHEATDCGGEWVLAYALLAEYFGKGIGSAAVGTVMRWAEDMGVREVWAEIQTINTPSLGLVKKLGFTHDSTVMRKWTEHRGGGEREIQRWVWRSDRE